MQVSQKTLRIVIDSAGDLPDGWAAAYDIQTIPINIHFGEKMYLSGVDLSDRDFYAMASESRIFPKTSQPTPHQFIEFYRTIARPGDEIISIHVTGKLSGTLTSAQIAARELAGKLSVFPVDSASGSAIMGYMAREARWLDQSGMGAENIVKRLESIAARVQIVLTLKTLDFARRSGRVKALQAALASLLDVKPVIVLKQGVLEMGDRVRTRRRALDHIVEMIAERLGAQPLRLAVIHAEDPASAEILVELAQKSLNIEELIVTNLSIGIAANLGPGTVGVAAYPLDEPG